ncbi:topology modulation protein [Enterococcus sp. 2201sp1_2201st1_B8_2201SCRN_220225]|uniref:topology modulation protein n=1 Tax=unclassified Enterococcus TaxID=2608891 RepID=UPI0034A45E2D
MNNYQRILVLGSPGSGKSTLTKQIAQKRQLSIISLDSLFWLDDEKTITTEELKAKLIPLMKEKYWIMDGNFASTLPQRLEQADLVIYLKVPRLIAMYRVLKRYLHYRGRKNPSGNPDRMDLEFLRYIWDFPKSQEPLVKKYLAQHPDIYCFKAHNAQEVFEHFRW